MSKEIKSIKFKQVRIIETEPNAKISDHGKFFAVQEEGSEIPDYWVGKEYVDSIEYKTPKILKRADGSLIWNYQNIKERTIVIGWQDYEYTTYCQVATKETCDLGYVFLYPEDDHLAEKKAEMLTKKREIKFEIDRLNAEEGWVANFEDNEDEDICFFYLDEGGTIEIGTENNQCDLQYMPRQTAETILDKYSQDELKQYLGIII